MSNIVTSNSIESVLIQGDLSKLTPEQRVSYYNNVCESVGLNPLTKPFDYINLNGKLTLYAKRDATDQLRKIHQVSVTISQRERIEDIYVVTAKATSQGREDESTGAVNIAGLKGDALANALMKAETKAKRRVTLSICGLGILDETETDTIQKGPTNQTRDVQSVVPQSIPVRVEVTQPYKTITSSTPEPKKDSIEEIGKRVMEYQKSNPQAYTVGFGKYQGKTLEEIGATNVQSYLAFLKKSTKPQSPEAKVFISEAEAFLFDLSNPPKTESSLEVGEPPAWMNERPPDEEIPF